MSTAMPTPDLPRPELATSLPLLRARLEEPREFRIEQLVELATQELATEELAAAVAPAGPFGGQGARDELSVLLATAARQALSDIESALHRMDAGRYGMCLCCNAPIEIIRLYTVPQTALCEACQRGPSPH